MPGEFMRVTMSPALHGDCLWVEYGNNRKRRRILIDGGPIGAFSILDKRIADLPAGDRKFELIVLSHVDTDHVDGLVRLFAESPLRFAVDDVWFNGWRHLEQNHKLLGGMQGEYFSALISKRAPGRWNKAFKGKAIIVPDGGGAPPVVKLAGGMKLTLLSPTPATLEKMRTHWKKDVVGKAIKPGDLEAAWKKLASDKKYLPPSKVLGPEDQLAKLIAAQSRSDAAAPNGSSIAFLVEYAGKSCLFLADAHHGVVAPSLRELLKVRKLKRLKVDAFKAAHHGSRGNTSVDLMSLIDAKYFLISSNGQQFKHPDKEAIARMVGGGGRVKPVLCFNYRTKFNEYWFDEARQKALGYSVKAPSDEFRGVTLAL